MDASSTDSMLPTPPPLSVVTDLLATVVADVVVAAVVVAGGCKLSKVYISQSSCICNCGAAAAADVAADVAGKLNPGLGGREEGSRESKL